MCQYPWMLTGLGPTKRGDIKEELPPWMNQGDPRVTNHGTEETLGKLPRMPALNADRWDTPQGTVLKSLGGPILISSTSRRKDPPMMRLCPQLGEEWPLSKTSSPG